METTTERAPLSYVEDRRRFVSEAFHSFHQPLTALHCGLELTLLRKRDEEEYRARVQEALVQAGVILKMNSAVRGLVESVDPGENFGRVQLVPLLQKLISDLAVVGDAAMVSVELDAEEEVDVLADAAKLTRNLGNLGALLIRSVEPGAILLLGARISDGVVMITMNLEGKRREVEADDFLQARLDPILIDTACSYTWTLGGEFCKTRNGFVISLPALE